MIITIPGYQFQEEPIYNGSQFIIFSGLSPKKEPIIIKMLKSKYPSPEEVRRFKQEYEITKILESDQTVHVYGFEKLENSYGMILENIIFPTLLEELEKRTQFNIHDFLEISIKIANALNYIHKKNITHKNLNPDNIFCDVSRKIVRIVDFHLATTLQKEKATFIKPKLLEETLNYISPEQTGRINRKVDYRTDFYSLGIIFYQMLTGVLPFDSSNPIELIYSHIAATPKSPREMDVKIPEMISAIVMKLIKKNPEERYQNIHALMDDLTNGLQQLEQTGSIEIFPLSKKKLPNRFQIQEKLYGRESEIKKLLDTYDKVAKGAVEFMLVTGDSGIGKSSLINEIQRPILQKRGFYISGKFEQFNHNAPYAALIQAFTDLVNQLLNEGDATIALYQKKIIDSVKGYGKVLLNVIPNLALLIGKQPPLFDLGSTELENQFSYMFQNFISAIATPEHPIVIFVDNLQWADHSSLKMIESLLTSPDCHHLYIIGAYQTDQINSSHSTSTFIESLKNQNIIPAVIELQPLTLSMQMDLLVDISNQDKDSVCPLAELCHEKTKGNPLLLIHLLKKFNKSGFITFNNEKCCYEWDFSKIGQIDLTYTILELMKERILELHPTTQKALHLAACMGNSFDLTILTDVADLLSIKESKDILINLVPALQEDLIDTDSNTFMDHYQFSHDRWQEAIYSLMDEETKQIIHIHIARTLLKKLTIRNYSQVIFDVVYHYNLSNLFSGIDISEKKKIAKLNLSASKIAKKSVAFPIALDYIKAAMKYTDPADWKTHYLFMLKLYTEATENSFLVKNYDEFENFSKIGISNAKNILDEINILKIKVLVEASQNKQRQSVETVISTIARLGIKLPSHPTKLNIFMDILKIKFLVNRIGISNITQLPRMTDPVKKAVVDMITMGFPCAYQSYPELFPILVCTNVALSLQYGNTEGSAYAYCVFGIISIGALGEINKGFEFGQASIRLMELLHDIKSKTKIAFGYYGGIKHWKDSIYTCIPQLVEGFETGLAYGDLEYACYCIHIYISQAFNSGIPLTELSIQTAYYKNRIKKIQHRSIYNFISTFHQAINNFIEMRNDPDILEGEFYNERIMIPYCKETGDLAALFNTYYCKLELAFFFEKYDQAIEYIAFCDKYIHIVYSLFSVPAYYMYKALTLLSIYPSSSKVKQYRILNDVHQALKKLEKWSNFSPSNHLQKYLLVNAELMSIQNKNESARLLYDQAIAASKENQFLHEEALSKELAARFYLKADNQKFAKAYMEEAYHSYLIWGAKAKIAQLESKYSHLMRHIIRATSSLEEWLTSKTESREYSSEILDLVTIQKTVNIISSTIMLNDLLKTLMHILIVNAGAQKCILLLEKEVLGKEGDFVIEAECRVGQAEDSILQSIPISDELLPVNLINYVVRKRDTVVLDNATHSGSFVANPYIVKNQCKSILCMPLFHQEALIGILYLENNLAKSVFTSTRVDFLKFLSSQISTSINNAKAYEKIMRLNKDLAILEQAYEKYSPKEFLNLLEKASVVDINLGDHIQKEMTVLFSDIRNITSQSTINHYESLSFINSFLNIIGPLIRKYNGFIDKYIGHAIMAIFPGSADDAISCAIEMQKRLAEYNQSQNESITMGVGINSGLLALGIIGEEHRMNATVISNAVNIASRLESLAKELDRPILITDTTYKKLKNPAKYSIQLVDTVTLKGMERPETIYAIYGMSAYE